MTLSLIIPFYNEKKGLLRTYKKVATFLKKNHPDYELIMIDDGSVDGSFDLIEPFAKKDKKLRLIKSFPNRGRGFVLTKAFKKARGNVVGHIDADLEIDIKYLSKAMKIIETGKADLAIASKNHPKSKIVSSAFRKHTGKIYGLIMKLILGLKLHSYQSGLKLFRRKNLNKILHKITSPKWFWDTEILYWFVQSGFKISEFPIKATYGRNSHTSPIKDAIKVIKEALQLRWRIRKSR